MQLSNILATTQRTELSKKFSGGYSEGDPPVPIPNTVVKPFSADDTSGATPRESRSLPGFLSQGRHPPALIAIKSSQETIRYEQ